MENVPLLQETTSRLLERNRRLYPDKTAFIYDGAAYTWTSVEALSDRIAVGMMEKGVRKGTHVGFWSMNDIHLVLYLIAAMKIGAIAAAINYSYRTCELRNVLRRADVELLFLGENKKGSDYRCLVEEVHVDCPRLGAVYDMADDFAMIKHTLPPDRSLPTGIAASLKERKDAVVPDDVATITFTSGTTKEPKPVMLTHYSIINDVNQFTHRMRVSIDNGDVLMAPLPLFHSSGLSGMLFFAIVVGIPAIIHRSFVAEPVLEDMEHYHVTALMAVPSMLELLINHENFSKYNISSLRIVQTSGSSTSSAKLQKIAEVLNLESLLIGYGQTECSPLITTVLYNDDIKTVTETVGIPFPHEEVRIWDLKNDCKLSAGQTGEIQVRGFNTMKGYYNFEEEQKKKYTVDGWLKTTDAGFLDERGYLHFVTRISENIIRHGENISPAEVESVVEMFCQDILTVKVVGVPEEIVQEEIACLIQTKSSQIVPDDLRAFVKRKLASYKVPKYIFQLDEFPMTATGKIDQVALKRIAEEQAAKEKQGLTVMDTGCGEV